MAKRKTPSEPGEPTPAGTPEYTVLARRYRPQQFRDLLGQEATAQALVNALIGNRVAHAYLFTGARGVGKTSTARILAKALNCVKGPTPTPCDACDMCQSIAAGEDVDVLEIDGASNRGIDEVRDIRQNVQFRPSRSRYKIYIIDEVHMLTPPAFNALLKTLEEPPAHVKFIFATTEVQKIPVTILSRCQRFDFAGIGTGKIVERLGQVVAGEGLQADDEALQLVARRAGGSMRDAQSLLDQLLAFGGDRLRSEDVNRLLGTASDTRLAALASAVLERDARRALELFGQAAEEGLQLGELLDQMMDYWRDLMVVCSAGAKGQSLSVSGTHKEALVHQAQALQLDAILAGLDILSTTKARLRGSSHARVLMEMALVRLTRLDTLVSLSQLAQWLQAPPAPGSVSRVPAMAAPPEAAKKNSRTHPSGLAAGVEPPKVDESTPLKLTSDSVPQVWPEILRQLPPFLASQAERAGFPAIFGPSTLVLRFPGEYNSEREYCQEPSRLARLQDVIRKVVPGGWVLRVESTGSTGTAPPADEAGTGSQSLYRRQRAEALQEPLVKRAIDVLEAQIVRVDEGFGAAPAESRGRTDGVEEEA
jgi:DNA polymerase-3 subunit gamma/tau